MIIGYTTGVYDLFHVGHVNLLRNARALCDKLIVGVTVDELVSYKNKSCVIPFRDRIEVVRACKYVDVAIPQMSVNKVEAVAKLKVNLLFVGDDWYASESWDLMETKLAAMGCQITYFPYTSSVSSTLINSALTDLRG